MCDIHIVCKNVNTRERTCDAMKVLKQEIISLFHKITRKKYFDMVEEKHFP